MTGHFRIIYADHSAYLFSPSFNSLLPNAKVLSKMKVANFVALSQTVLAAADAGSCKSPQAVIDGKANRDGSTTVDALAFAARCCEAAGVVEGGD